MFRKRDSLVWRIALPFALLLTLAMGALSVYLSSYFRQSTLNILQQNLEADARLVADQLSSPMAKHPPVAEADRLAQQYASLLNLQVTILDNSGLVLGVSSPNPQESGNYLDLPEVQRALKGAISTETRFSEPLHANRMYAAAPMLENGKIVGIAHLALSLNAMQANLNRIQATVTAAAALTLILALVLSILIASYTISPLRRLTSTVRKFANGETNPIENSSANRRDEIGQLYHTFYLLAQQHKTQIIELQTERGKLEAMLANISDGIIIVDDQGIVQLINPAARRLFQNDNPRGIGSTLIEVVRHHQLVELWRKSLITGDQETATLETTPDRSFVQGIATPLQPTLPGQTLLLLQDLTRVRRLETVRRDFVSNVSHELRTPLASLKALIETLQEGALDDPPAARRFLQRMETEIDNLTQMVHELLELSRIESNRVPLHIRPISVNDLVLSIVERMRLQAERAGLSLHQECPDTIPQVRADPDRMSQVLMNLIHNAIKFTPPGGEILLSAYPEGKNVIIFVRDSGVGISPEALPRIFERFYKADRSRSGGGTGLGLSISRHLVEAHGGHIWAESALNQGSTFYFSLPVA